MKLFSAKLSLFGASTLLVIIILPLKSHQPTGKLTSEALVSLRAAVSSDKPI